MCKRLIEVVSQNFDAELFPQRTRGYIRNTAQNAAAYLDVKGIIYELIWKRLEFEQPFSSLEDARDYVKTYAPDIGAKETETFLQGRVIRTESPAFSWYLPRKKTAGIFFINGGLS